jgi:hypothetical protein
MQVGIKNVHVRVEGTRSIVHYSNTGTFNLTLLRVCTCICMYVCHVCHVCTHVYVLSIHVKSESNLLWYALIFV